MGRLPAEVLLPLEDGEGFNPDTCAPQFIYLSEGPRCERSAEVLRH